MYKNQQPRNPIFLPHRHPLSLPSMWDTRPEGTWSWEKRNGLGTKCPAVAAECAKTTHAPFALVIRKMSISH